MHVHYSALAHTVHNSINHRPPARQPCNWTLIRLTYRKPLAPHGWNFKIWRWRSQRIHRRNKTKRGRWCQSMKAAGCCFGTLNLIHRHRRVQSSRSLLCWSGGGEMQPDSNERNCSIYWWWWSLVHLPPVLHLLGLLIFGSNAKSIKLIRRNCFRARARPCSRSGGVGQRRASKSK